MRTTHSARIVWLSEEIYRQLVLLYPKAYRQKYGLDMKRTFQDCCRFAYEESGMTGLISLWAPTMLDLLANAFKRRFEDGLRSEKLKLIRFVSAAAVVAGLFGSTTEWGIIKNILIAPLLLISGLAGLYLTGEGAKRTPQLAFPQYHQRVQWAFRALLATTLFASLHLLGGFIFGSEESIQQLGGSAGYLSMAASHLAAFILGLWLYRRASLWATPLGIVMGATWAYWSSNTLIEISISLEFGSIGISMIADLVMLLFAAATVLTSLRAIPVLRRAANPERAI